MIKTYSEMLKYRTLVDRFNYLKLSSRVGIDTFGYERYLNQLLYRSSKWRSVRDRVIIRDESCNLALENYEIFDKILVHHINPITVEEIEKELDSVFDLEGLVCTNLTTHNAIHYGDESRLVLLPVERFYNDTKLW